MTSANARVNRRQLLVAGAALAVVGSAGTLWLAMRSHETQDWIQAVVRKHLPSARLDAASLRAFATTLANEPAFRSQKIALALDVDALAPAIVRIAPEVSRKIEQLERRVLSSYLLASNFFRVGDPRTDTILCGEPMPACGNPFAQFLRA